MTDVNGSVSAHIRVAIEDFLAERCDTKLKGLSPDDEKYQNILAQHERDTWISDAAKRVSQLQLITHSFKGIHSDAKGTNLYVDPQTLSDSILVGSHNLKGHFDADVTGNAAALDVYKFLRLDVDGRTLLDRVLVNDEALLAGLSDNESQAKEWVAAFSAITTVKGEIASHVRGKQLYWLVGEEPTCNDNYILLSVLYPTSLVHKLYLQINDDRFSESAKAARLSKRENRMSEQDIHEYPGVAVQKLGGTKPQNISQLNSERGGQNYLLSSQPPNWSPQGVRPLFHTPTAFNRFGRRSRVRRLSADLSHFLLARPRKNYQTRDLVDDYLAELVDELHIFVYEIHQLPSGWSADNKCDLPEEERFWLDPERSRDDPEFLTARQHNDWPLTIRDRFANWINGTLHDLIPGDPEYHEWHRRLGKDASFNEFLRQDVQYMNALEQELSEMTSILQEERDS